MSNPRESKKGVPRRETPKAAPRGKAKAKTGGLYAEWKNLIENQTDTTFSGFWEKYCDAESRIYTSVLGSPRDIIQGKFSELAARWNVEAVFFMGFLDGVSESLQEPLDLENVTEDSDIRLEADFEKLYFNMCAAKADHLYDLPAWDGVLSTERRAEIAKAQKRAGIVVKEKRPGRNDPCPCGSGKKYKKCCGA